ncbi:uncharacterized protein LY79DRAFT_562993 [Colletotrichum navitas]|uniref:Uncharacterized protein n=1 Tax=Colletotrichum navitas TaxID=681940 RepID=A0AAD8PSL8_9PEZI|nr:uncharacterized protein LY79DRAFT_562993 [Colletotrichum navitas]KAK1579979.1 hypothetical protein LY79DRAFT_562993 [Colletotrichum navitas]
MVIIRFRARNTKSFLPDLMRRTCSGVWGFCEAGGPEGAGRQWRGCNPERSRQSLAKDRSGPQGVPSYGPRTCWLDK